MHSSEPIEPRIENDPSRQALADESWRAEVASRVNSYRARRKHGRAEEHSAALDFGPAAEAQSFNAKNSASLSPASQGLGSRNNVASNRVTQQSEEPQSAARPHRNAFDTNYYRRLNAESMAQAPGMRMSATATAAAQEFEAEFEAESDAGVPDRLCDTPGPLPADAGDDPALDLEIRPTAAGDFVLDRYCISNPEPAQPLTPPIQAAPLAQGNLIVFRRPLMEPPLLAQPSRDELAEPMNNRPRILEVPEDIMPPMQGSLFPEIRLDADEQESSSNREPEIAMPLPVAPVSERLMASLTDLCVVLAAGLLFAGMALRALPEIPHTKPFWMVLGAVTLLFWAVYQHMFLLYAGRTPGMSMRGIRLSTFDGRVPEWKQRSRRARFVFVSFASVALGFIWALVDEDALCWHDRVSQTFPTAE
jgi:uncharacterized RDD family membrane protein YckC